MNRIFCIILTALTCLLLFNVLPVKGQNQQMQEEWTGKLKDGTIITRRDLEKILSEHQKWIETDKKEGKRAILFRADLSGADLSEASLSGAHLSGADLSGADLSGAKLSGAHLSGADLSGAKLSGAKLSGASLSGADLSEADLSGAILSGADLSEANLSEADLSMAELRGAIFQPNLLPTIRGIAFAFGMSEMTYISNDFLSILSSPQALTELREGFKEAGLRTQEREITYAIKHTERQLLWDYEFSRNPTWDKFESLFNIFFFEWTCLYGMKPGRPLIILFFAIIPLFSIPYSVVLMRPPKRDGIWKVWISDRVRKDLGSEEPVRLNLGFFSALRLGFYFSLISAFSIGWRELNVGNWITRIQSKEYTLRASGWVRAVSGAQSLVSVYMLALWVLTYFGRPFETV